MAESSQRWGLYEKALPPNASWRTLLSLTTSAGYDFLEISIDESEERLGRLEWSRKDRRALHDALRSERASIDTMCLSGHRKYPLGSSSKTVRERGLEIMKRAVEFSADFGIRIIQVAGYDVHYEESTEQTRGLFQENILRSATWAREHCVMLALENVDCPLVDSVTKSLRYVQAAATPWFQLYPDIGNLAASGCDVPAELEAGSNHIVAVHVKDARSGEIRRVPYGEGIVDFEAAFRSLKKIEFRGPLVVEMWNDVAADALRNAQSARRWLKQKLDAVFG